MEDKKQKLSKIALIVAGIGAFASLALALIIKDFSLPIQIALGVTLVSLVMSIVMDPLSIKKWLQGRQARYSSNALLLTIAFLVILVIVNLLSYKNTIRWDLTEDKQNTLSEETLNTLESLDKPVQAKAFFSNRMSTVNSESVLKNYEANSNNKFSYEFIDPDRDPVAATEAGITRDGSVVLTLDNQKQIITSVNEEQITSALIRLSQPGERAIYFLTGHGERSIIDGSEDSYLNAVSELESKNYIVSELNLLAANTIPDNALAIIIAGPQKPLSSPEVALISEYQSIGGSILVMYEPSLLNQFGNLDDPLSAYLGELWGITINDDFVIDPTANPVTVSVSASYASHPITDSLENMVAVLPSSRSLTIDPNIGQAAIEISFTTDQAWAEIDLESLKANVVEFSAGLDTPGPITLVVAAENSAAQSRMVVFGDTDFADDSFYTYYGNADLFLNAVDWASNQDELISLTPRSQTTRVIVTPQVYAQRLIMFGSIILFPLLIIVAAIVVFIRRKREI